MKLENVGNNRNAAYLVVEYKWFLSHISVELCEQQVKVKSTVLSLHDNCLIYKSVIFPCLRASSPGVPRGTGVGEGRGEERPGKACSRL